MKSSSLIIVLLLFGICIDSIGAKQIIYLSPSGNDRNPGTKREPVQTCQKACERAANVAKTLCHGDTVEISFANGTYTLQAPLLFSPIDFGEKDVQVFFKAQKSGKVVLNGGFKIKGWQTDDGKIYRTQLPKNESDKWNFRHLYIGGKKAIRARTPNIEAMPKYITIESVTRTKNINSNQTFSNQEKEINGWTASDKISISVDSRWVESWNNLNDVEIVCLTNWASTHKKIQQVYPDKGEIILQTPHVNYWGYNRPKKDWPCFFENAYEFLDTENEWYLNRSTGILYCIPPKGVDLNRVNVVISNLTSLIEGHGKPDNLLSDIHFEGISFEYCEWIPPTSGHNGRQGCYDYGGDDESGYIQGAINFGFAENISFKECSFKHFGGGGISFRNGTRNIEMTGNVFTDISGNGISIGEELKGPLVPENMKITNNLFDKCANEYFGGNAIFVSIARNVLISHNLIYDLPYSGIATGWWWPGSNNPYEKWQNYSDSTACAGNIIIEFNHIYNVMQEVSDGGGIYTLGPQPHSVMRFNLIHGIKSNHVPNSKNESQPIFFDGRTAGFRVEGNVTFDYHAGATRRNQPTKDEDYRWINNHFDESSKDSLQYFEAGQKAGLEPYWKRKLIKANY